jgi:hypothetical protein
MRHSSDRADATAWLLAPPLQHLSRDGVEAPGIAVG